MSVEFAQEVRQVHDFENAQIDSGHENCGSGAPLAIAEHNDYCNLRSRAKLDDVCRPFDD